MRHPTANASGARETCYHAGLRFALRARLGGLGGRALYRAALLSAFSLLAPLSFGGCGPKQPAAPPATPPPPPPPPPPVSWFTAAMAWPALTPRPFVSQHLGERHLAVLRVSPEAQPTYQALVPDSSFGPGTLFIESLSVEATGAPGPVLALERTESDWRYWLLRPDGTVDREARPSECAPCHAAAPAAPLFGLPNRAGSSR